MSALPDQPTRMTEAEYLAFERDSAFKHEFLNGTVFAMSGASEAHNLISGNVMTALKNQLRGRPCKVYPADMRVKVRPTGLYTYPDISVVCGDAHIVRDGIDSLLNPTLIIEILSPSTELYDRGKKFQHYRQLESLQAYVLIAQDSPRVEQFTRQGDGFWQFAEAVSVDAALDLTALGCTLRLADVYGQVDFAAGNAEGNK